MFSEAKADPVDDSLPSEAKVKEAFRAVVKDEKGQSHPLSSLTAKDGKKMIIIFIRHNHCGMCMEYVRACSKNEKLAEGGTSNNATSSPPFKVIVVGHGSWEGIEMYRRKSECAFEIYMDEEKKIYNTLGLTRRFLGKSKEALQKDGGKPSYIQEHQSPISLAFTSFWGQLTSGHLLWKGGDVTLLGGEFVFDQQDMKCTFAHRMKDSTDHTKVEDLARQLES